MKHESARGGGSRNLLVAGIDAGLNTSFALIDLDGGLVALNSLYSAAMSDILKEMTGYGDVVIVSTDRAKAPVMARKVASSISAKLVLPARNMTKKKKRMLIEEYSENTAWVRVKLTTHEKAALASAIFAYKKLRPTINKLRDHMKKKGESHKFREERDRLILKNLSRADF